MIKPKNQSMGLLNCTFPLYMVKSQLKIFTPVGTAMIIVIKPKNALTLGPAPIVKKWCSQTTKDKNVIATSAQTMEVYPKSFFLEKVATTSEKIPNAGR